MVRLMEPFTRGLVALVACVSAAAQPQPVVRLGGFSSADTPHTRPSLIARTEGVQRGGSVDIALRLQLDPGWHVYWENPGDAGLEPRLKWTLPAGASVSNIDWPAPHYVKDKHGLVTYLYEGDVVLPLTLTLDEGFAGDRVAVVADTSWLVCREACLPGKAQLTLDLPVVDDAPAQADGAVAAAFASLEARRPVAGGPDAVRRVDHVAGRLSLDIDAKHLAALGAGAVEARIMPAAPGLVDESAPHTAAWTAGGGLRVTAPRTSPDPASPHARGFVELRGGEQTLIFRFGPPVVEPAD